MAVVIRYFDTLRPENQSQSRQKRIVVAVSRFAFVVAIVVVPWVAIISAAEVIWQR
jgi:hypothetical protein